MISRHSFIRPAIVLTAALGVGLGLPAVASGDGASTASMPSEASVDGQASQTLRVGIKPLDPFVLRSGEQYSGFSIELWDEIARRNNWTTSYVWHDTLPPLLDDVTSSKLDVGIAGISITREREARLDFSHPMFNSGLQVLTPRQGGEGLLARLGHLASASVGQYLLGLVVVILIAGNAVWFFERRKHENYARGIGHGMFRAAGVGLVGDLGEPGHSLGEAARVVWAIVGICFVSAFTASLTTELTVREIQGSIRGVNDLVDRRVVTVQGSTAAAYLTDRRIDFEAVGTADEAFARLDDGDAEAMVFDAPVLHHHIEVTGSDRLTLVGNVFQREDYGIAVPTGSSLRESINATLLQMRADGSYNRIYEHYFGRTE